MRRTIRGGLLLTLPNKKNTPEYVSCPPVSLIGIPTEGAELFVEDGAAVRIGDRLAVRDNLPTLSPISGTVRIENGILFVENDNENAENPDPIPQIEKELDALTPADVVDAVREAGIPASSGAPLWKKLERAASGSYLVGVPAFDPEPDAGVSGSLARIHADRLVSALKLIMVVFSAGQGRILLSFSDKQGRKVIREAIGDFSSKIRIQKVIPAYPAHLERPLFTLLTGKELNYRKSPEDAGVLILTPAELLAVADLFFSGRRYTHTYVAISGVGIEEPMLLQIPVGARIGDLPVIGRHIRQKHIIENGLMSGNPVRPEDFVRPTTHSLTVISPPIKRTAENCIGCDRCFRVCPMYLSPRIILQTDIRKDSPAGRLIGKLGLGKKQRALAVGCIGCGCCSYVCPAKLPLTEKMSQLKSQTEVTKS